MKRSYERRRRLYGYGFIGVWLLGAIQWFLIPLIASVLYSFQEVNPNKGGMTGIWVGLSNYRTAFFSDPNFRTNLLDALRDTALQTPLILIFSLFIAVLLNQKFRGRTLARAMFFLPVIIATGPVYNIISGNMATGGGSSAEQFSTLFETNLVDRFLTYLGLYGTDSPLTTLIRLITDNLQSLVWHSGVQILIFLAALQSIPTSAREAAEIEGAGAWDFFWRITLPYVSPMILANLIYTVLDAFTAPDNVVMQRVLAVRQDSLHGLASAMAWSYFLVVLVVVGIVVALLRHAIYYESE